MKMIGEYALLQRLGKGGMGQIWRARREVLGGASTNVAIKLMSGDISPDLNARKHFMAEARLSLLLRSSNIVRVFDIAQTHEGVAYIVMEWIDGLNLAQLCKKMWEKGETLSPGAIAYTLAEIAKGIMHAHELRANGANLTVIHRDISPHNIMLSRRGEVKLLDFGIARVATEDTSATLAAAGKIRYMPPEQFRGKTRHPTVDIFPVGAILHELLDQRKFRFVAVDQMQLYGLSLAGIVPPLSPETQAPARLVELRERLLRYEPRERPQSARELFEELIGWEGYHNATLELEDMVRRHLGPSIDPTTDISDAPTDIEPSDARAPVKREGPLPSTRKPPVRLPVSAPTTVVQPSPRSGGLATRHQKIAVGIAGATMLSLALGGYLFNPLATEPSEERAASSELVASTAMSPALSPTLDPQLETAPQPALDGDAQEAGASERARLVQPEPEREQGSVASSDLVPQTADPPPPKPVAMSTKLTVRRAGVPWAQVKIGKHLLTLDASMPSKTQTILSRRYETKYRTKFDGDWQSGPELNLSERRVEIEVDSQGIARNE